MTLLPTSSSPTNISINIPSSTPPTRRKLPRLTWKPISLLLTSIILLAVNHIFLHIRQPQSGRTSLIANDSKDDSIYYPNNKARLSDERKRLRRLKIDVANRRFRHDYYLQMHNADTDDDALMGLDVGEELLGGDVWTVKDENETDVVETGGVAVDANTNVVAIEEGKTVDNGTNTETVAIEVGKTVNNSTEGGWGTNTEVVGYEEGKSDGGTHGEVVVMEDGKTVDSGENKEVVENEEGKTNAEVAVGVGGVGIAVGDGVNNLDEIAEKNVHGNAVGAESDKSGSTVVRNKENRSKQGDSLPVYDESTAGNGGKIMVMEQPLISNNMDDNLRGDAQGHSKNRGSDAENRLVRAYIKDGVAEKEQAREGQGVPGVDHMIDGIKNDNKTTPQQGVQLAMEKPIIKKFEKTGANLPKDANAKIVIEIDKGKTEGVAKPVTGPITLNKDRNNPLAAGREETDKLVVERAQSVMAALLPKIELALGKNMNRLKTMAGHHQENAQRR
ncbi:hypothetical protein HDU76_010488 [Blyttiomyces sp. JEL0837]|nr:hypothetical protein HDU76_010488 [Blyttiomyces sp. JEL0837]